MLPIIPWLFLAPNDNVSQMVADADAGIVEIRKM